MNKLLLNLKNLFTIRELIILVTGLTLVFISNVYLKSNILSVISAISTILVAIFQAKGKVFGEILGIFDSILYAYLAYLSRFYGETIIYLFLMVPIYMMGVILWKKHYDLKRREVIKYNFTRKDILKLFCITIILFLIVYFFLKIIGTAELLSSTISFFTSIYATYLVAVRSKYGFYIYVLDDVVMIALWGSLIIRHDYSYVPIVIGQSVNLFNDVYGSLRWSKKNY